jgi:arginine N-succinyltransferase
MSPLLVRPAGPADFEALWELAVMSGSGFTSLPEHEPTLQARLECSADSFSGRLAPLESWYTLMLEDASTGEIDGVAGVKAAVGLKRPFFSFRVITLAQSSPTTGARFDHKALVLVNECAGWTEVGSLFLKPSKRKSGGGRLLALSRYLLIGAEPQRFSEHVLAELRGWFEPDGACPFWENLACKFFRMPFADADRMSAATDGQFILDLAPRHPIYLELLPDAVRDVVGAVHAEGEAARAMLEREGFRPTGLIDIFDGGPTVACPRDQIRTVRESLRLRAQLALEVDAPAVLVSTDTVAGFRATRAPVVVDGDLAVLPAWAAELLGVRDDDAVRVRLGA